MAASLAALANAYDTDSDQENNEPSQVEDTEFLKKPIDPSMSIISTISIDAAPVVLYNGVNIYFFNLIKSKSV